MSISEVLANLEKYDEESLILVAKNTELTGKTDAMVVPIPKTLGTDPAIPGFDYLVEVYHARDVLETWKEWRNNKVPTAEEAIEAILFYQQNDAYLPTEEMKRQGLE
jgi:hypothetical protein